MKTKYLPFNKRLLLVKTHVLFWCGIRRLSSQSRSIQVQKDEFVGRSAPGSAARGHGLVKPEKG